MSLHKKYKSKNSSKESTSIGRRPRSINLNNTSKKSTKLSSASTSQSKNSLSSASTSTSQSKNSQSVDSNKSNKVSSSASTSTSQSQSKSVQSIIPKKSQISTSVPSVIPADIFKNMCNKMRKIIFIILSLVYLFILLAMNNTGLSFDIFKNITDKLNVFTNITDKLNVLKNNITDSISNTSTELNINQNKWFVLIVITIALGVILIMRNIYKIYKSKRKTNFNRLLNRLNDSFFVAFIFSLSVLISSSIRDKPNYKMTMITFIIIFLKSFVVKGFDKFESNNIFHYLVFALLIIPLLSMFMNENNMSFEFNKTNLIISIINACISSLAMKTLINNKQISVISILIQLSYYTYLFNITTSSDSNMYK